MIHLLRALLILALLLLWMPLTRPAAQELVDCGVVDEIVPPIDGIRTTGDDFARFRGRFGGLHTGVDVAFNRYGDPVHAIARGRVTYSDPEGWDTEKGVVIVEHTFPDGEVFYSLYGHMEPLFDYFFPSVGQCVTPESIVGTVGDPSLSAPHLHFEIRTFGPDDGGPGYWDTNPLEAGWLHPLDFLALWQVRLEHEDAYVSHVSALHPPGVPPLITTDGGLVVANGALLEGVGPEGSLRWRMELSSTVAGVVLLPDGRVLARTADDGIMVMREGRYEAIWRPERPLSGAPILLGDAVAFFTTDNALAAYTPDGTLLWRTPPLGDRLDQVALQGDRIAVGTRPLDPDAAPAWYVIDATGAIRHYLTPTHPPLAAFGPQGDYYLLNGATLYHIAADFAARALATLPRPAGRTTALIADGAGNVYVFQAGFEDNLYAFDSAGALRWVATLPGVSQPPLLAVGEGCLLYALSANGTLAAFRTGDGAQVGSAALYTGGENGHPGARLLEVLPGEQVRFGVGFLTVLTLDGYALAGMAAGECAQP